MIVVLFVQLRFCILSQIMQCFGLKLVWYSHQNNNNNLLIFTLVSVEVVDVYLNKYASPYTTIYLGKYARYLPPLCFMGFKVTFQ